VKKKFKRYLQNCDKY